MKKYIVLLLMVLSIALLSAYSITDSWYGNRVLGWDARTTAMGNAGSASSARLMNSFLNPATLGYQQQGFAIAGSAANMTNEDNRSLPLYNSFDLYFDSATYSSNMNGTGNYSGIVSYNMPKGNWSFGIAAGYRPLVDYTGKYDEQVRNNRNSNNDGYPEIIARNYYRNDGRLDAMSGILSASWAPDYLMLKKASLGVEVASLSADANTKKTIRWSDWSIQQVTNNVTVHRNVLPDYTSELKRDITGSMVKIGILASLSERATVAFQFQPKTSLSVDAKFDRYTVNADTTMHYAMTKQDSLMMEDYDMPTTMRFGLSFLPRNIMRTEFVADIEYVKWSDISSRYDDVYNYYFGVEHSVYGKYPLRMGFGSEVTYQTIVDNVGAYANKITTPTVSVGTGFAVSKNVMIDLSGSYSFREYQALDLFADSYYNDKTYTGLTSYLLWPNSHITPSDRGWENPDTVKESFYQLMTSVTWRW